MKVVKGTWITRVKRLLREWRKRNKKKWQKRREWFSEKFGKTIMRWWQWNCGLWHLVDLRTLMIIAWVQAILALAFAVVRTYEVIQFAVDTGREPHYITLGNAYFRTALYVLCCVGEVRLVHRAARLESRSDLLAAAFLEIVIAAGPLTESPARARTSKQAAHSA